MPPLPPSLPPQVSFTLYTDAYEMVERNPVLISAGQQGELCFLLAPREGGPGMGSDPRSILPRAPSHPEQRALQ